MVQVGSGLEDGVGRSDKENSDEEGVGRLLCVADRRLLELKNGSSEELSVLWKDAAISARKILCTKYVGWLKAQCLMKPPSRWAPKMIRWTSGLRALNGDEPNKTKILAHGVLDEGAYDVRGDFQRLLTTENTD